MRLATSNIHEPFHRKDRSAFEALGGRVLGYKSHSGIRKAESIDNAEEPNNGHPQGIDPKSLGS